jgi:transcriptional regulator with XRE-family HTH domain
MLSLGTMKKAQARAASKIKVLLAQKSKTIEKLAYEISMSKGFLSEFLSGKKDITLANLQRIADGLDVDIKDLFSK